MSQITLYLDDETEQLVAEAAKASGLSKSRWVAEVIRRHARDTWPSGWIELAGAFPDFPERDALMQGAHGNDLPRVEF